MKRNTRYSGFLKLNLFFVILCSLVLFTMFVQNAQAGEGIWTTNGPYGGMITVLAIDPLNPNTLFVGTQNSNSTGIFKSVDGGGAWQEISLPGIGSASFFAIAIDPINSSTVYAGGVMYPSEGDGFNRHGFYKSIDGGVNWTDKTRGLDGYRVKFLAIDPKDTSTVYAGTEQMGVYKSTNGAESWSSINKGLGSLRAMALAIDPKDPSVVYVSTYDGIYKSTDAGGNWNLINDWGAFSLVIDASNTSRILAGTGGAIYESINGGESWIRRDIGASWWSEVVSIIIDSNVPNTIYAGTDGSGVYKSLDGGLSWSEMDIGLRERNVKDLIINPDDTSIIFAGTVGEVGAGGVYKSVNGGESWSRSNTGLTAIGVLRAIAVDPIDSLIAYAGTNLGAWKTINGGESWNPISTGVAFDFAVDPFTPSTVYAAVGFLGVLKSYDAGANWNWSSSGLSRFIEDVEISLSNPSIVYAASDNGHIFKSVNGGTGWNLVSDALISQGFNSFIIDPINSSILYAGTYHGVYKSSDGGETWIPKNIGLPDIGIQGLAIDPSDSSTLYISSGHSDGNVFRTDDGAEHWVPINNGINSNVTSLAVNSSFPSTVYVGTWSGVYKSTNKGEHWVAYGTGLENIPVFTLTASKSSPTAIYAATGFGVYTLLAPLGDVNIQLYQGWNLIALPINPTTPLTAQSLLDLINSQGGDTTQIVKWNPETQSWITHINNIPINNFEIKPGEGYFVKSNKNSEVILAGTSINSSTPISFYKNWNLTGIPYPVNKYTAQTLLDEINNQGGNATQIVKWNPEEQRWITHIDKVPINDFKIKPDEGYFIKTGKVSEFLQF